MTYNFNFKKDDGKFTVEVDADQLYGYFECNRNGEGGGLWFERKPDGTLTLIDYDGTFELPDEVIDILRDAGFIVEKEFE